MGFLEKLFSAGTTKLVDSVGAVLDNVITSKEEKLQLANELAKAEMQYQLDVQRMNNEEKAMVLGDISNARQREVQIQSSDTATKLSKNITPYLALGTVLITLALFYVLVFSPKTVQGDSKDIVMYILGVLSAVLTQIYSYYFGSSAGSTAKNGTISNLINK